MTDQKTFFVHVKRRAVVDDIIEVRASNATEATEFGYHHNGVIAVMSVSEDRPVLRADGESAR